jgi:putative restriction endonuclease
MSDQLKDLEKAISKMRLGKVGGRIKPHKPLMLLAVLDLFDAHLLEDNHIFYNQDLVERFQEYFEAVKQEGDWCQPAPPFFHLRSANFWKHQPISGREERYSRLRSSGGGSKRIFDNILYAYLDDSAFAVFSDPDQRQELRRFILKTFFTPEEQTVLQTVIQTQSDISAYESALAYISHLSN